MNCSTRSAATAQRMLSPTSPYSGDRGLVTRNSSSSLMKRQVIFAGLIWPSEVNPRSTETPVSSWISPWTW
jgi:hypothetical protein